MQIFDTREQIEAYSWASLKMGLKLELVGLKVSRGVNVAKQAREALGVKTKNKKELLAMVEKKLAEVKEKLVMNV